ncbi:endonuclease/exonuclease/phosphatase family protein [Streptomyces sp. NPDC059218]|uniref:endonuclease/exonuclease/phosphatase family protein n=1 Tax=unclassified Streptomyces TaxID=2593676 RepID=UPI0036BE5A8A
MGSEPALGARGDVLRVVTYNVCEGGLDGDGVENGTGAIDISRWEQQIDLMGRLEPDVLCLQECKYYDRGGFEMAKRTGQALDMEWYLAPSSSHGSHLMTLVNPRVVEVRRFVPDAAERKLHHTLARADLVARRTGWNFTVLNTHLDPFSPANRIREASWLTEYGARDDVILAGDLNSEAPGDPAVTSWGWLPKELHSRHRFQNPDGTYAGSDRRALSALLHAGFRDPVTHLGFPPARTVGYWSPSERRDFRSDYVLPSRGLAPRLKNLLVPDTHDTRAMSDHLPVCADFALSHQ